MSISTDASGIDYFHVIEKRRDWLSRLKRAEAIMAGSFVCQIAWNNRHAVHGFAGERGESLLKIVARLLSAVDTRSFWMFEPRLLAFLVGYGSVASLAWFQLAGLKPLHRIRVLSLLFLLTAPLGMAVKIASVALYATAGLVVWYWPGRSSLLIHRLIRASGLVLAVSVFPLLGLCAVPTLRAKLKGEIVAAVVCGMALAWWRQHGFTSVPVWIGADEIVSRHNVGLMAALQWVVGSFGRDGRALCSRLGTLAFVAWVMWREWSQETADRRQALACVGTAVLATAGATTADGVVLLVPLALWVAPMLSAPLQTRAAGWLLITFLACKDYLLPGGIGLAAASNAWILAAAVCFSAMSVQAYLWSRWRFGIAAKLLRMLWANSNGRRYAAAVLTGCFVLILGRMTEDLSVGGRIWMAAWAWPRFLLLALFAAAHAWLVRTIWVETRVNGGIENG